MKLISWNVNGIRSCMGKGFEDSMRALDADAICLQEVKAMPDQVELDFPGYRAHWNCADKKGYSGTLVLSRAEPISVRMGLGIDEFDHEGRVITLEFDDFFLVNCYTPNSQDELRRLPHRMRWDDAFRDYLCQLAGIKPVAACGDLNVAHQEIDIKNARANRMHAGFTQQERDKFTQLLDAGFADSFRRLHPDEKGAYTWWSYFGNARANNSGWRLDYFVVSESLMPRVLGASIHPGVFGSDHCPVELLLG